MCFKEEKPKRFGLKEKVQGGFPFPCKNVKYEQRQSFNGLIFFPSFGSLKHPKRKFLLLRINWGRQKRLWGTVSRSQTSSKSSHRRKISSYLLYFCAQGCGSIGQPGWCAEKRGWAEAAGAEAAAERCRERGAGEDEAEAAGCRGRAGGAEKEERGEEEDHGGGGEAKETGAGGEESQRNGEGDAVSMFSALFSMFLTRARTSRTGREEEAEGGNREKESRGSREEEADGGRRICKTLLCYQPKRLLKGEFWRLLHFCWVAPHFPCLLSLSIPKMQHCKYN